MLACLDDIARAGQYFVVRRGRRRQQLQENVRRRFQIVQGQASALGLAGQESSRRGEHVSSNIQEAVD